MQNAPREHSAMLSAFIKLPFVVKIFWVTVFRYAFKYKMVHNGLVLSYLMNAQQILWSDWVDVQADLSPRWPLSQIVGFNIWGSFKVWMSIALGSRAFACWVFFMMLLWSAGSKLTFVNIISATQPGRQTIWIQIRNKVLQVQTVCKGYQQTTTVTDWGEAASRENLSSRVSTNNLLIFRKYVQYWKFACIKFGSE